MSIPAWKNNEHKQQNSYMDDIDEYNENMYNICRTNQKQTDKQKSHRDLNGGKNIKVRYLLSKETQRNLTDNRERRSGHKLDKPSPQL